ncbi:hypothetical protein EDC22_102108 [Tepidamorphus gemmatus]|uniref:Uncharacterized protein n=1 Tax=Tepidamorphus gemmatus TaxID=747076 RepID=A0A4V2UZS2_9HYPH|nr:hypothetical protein [Tepidamorphus gemmatus]TCT12423.1 hypothetical protein EDC22_102108 [Tepidamorphus gemmatus]
MRKGVARDGAPDLVAACEAARAEGLAFPAVWTHLLQFHPLVAGIPTHRIDEDGRAITEVALINGRRIVLNGSGYVLE